MANIIRLGGTPLPDVGELFLSSEAGKRALVLGGGGISGAAFHAGTLLALDDVLTGFGVNDFDMFVGTSAGAFLAACLANGISPGDFARSQLSRKDPNLPIIKRTDILKPVKGRLPRALSSSVHAITTTVKQLSRTRFDTSLVDTFFSLTEGLASWRLYTADGLEEYLSNIFTMGGRANRFDKLDKELYVVATDVDTAERIVFGEINMPSARISQSVAASAAIPIIYEPVTIGGREYLDGGLISPTNLDVALAHGAEFIVLINPLVPYLHDTRYLLRGFDSPLDHVSDGGLGRVIAQVFRIMAHAQIQKELDLLDAKYSDVNILVIEPHRNDEHLFVFNLMDYNARVQLAQDAFEQTAVDLVTHFPEIKNLFAKGGIEVSKTVLVEQLRRVLGGGTADALDIDRTELEIA
jgi:predicted acylesterase/phospholipase RssA